MERSFLSGRSTMPIYANLRPRDALGGAEGAPGAPAARPGDATPERADTTQRSEPGVVPVVPYLAINTLVRPRMTPPVRSATK